MNNRTKLGFALNDFGSSQLAFLFIKEANELSRKNLDIDIVGFYDSYALPCVDNNFPIISLSYAYKFNGPMILTSLNLAEKSLSMPYVSTRVLYMWDLDWTRPWKKSSWIESYRIYNEPKLKKVARCGDYAKIIQNVCGCQIDDVVEECNLERLIEVILRKEARRING